MRYRSFGTTGWQLSAIGFGGVPLSLGARPNEAQAITVLHHALGCGINLIDTADAYCRDETEIGHNERLIGKALSQLGSGERHAVRVFTKGGYTRPGGSWEPDGRPAHIRAACERSLLALGVETIDLYQHHTPDPEVPIAETIGEMKRLRDDGKIRHIGVSNYSVEQIETAREIVDIQAVQNQYSPRHRQPEHDGTLEATAELGLALIPWSPLGGMGGAKSLDRRAAALGEVANARRVSPHRVALAWLLSKGDHVFPIPGASRRETIEDSALAADLDLSDDEIEFLDGAL